MKLRAICEDFVWNSMNSLQGSMHYNACEYILLYYMYNMSYGKYVNM